MHNDTCKPAGVPVPFASHGYALPVLLRFIRTEADDAEDSWEVRLLLSAHGKQSVAYFKGAAKHTCANC